MRRLAHGVFLREAVDVLELLVDVVARHEDFAVVDRRVAVGRRDLVAVHVELLEVLEQLLDLAHVGFFVDRGVGADQETGGLGQP